MSTLLASVRSTCHWGKSMLLSPPWKPFEVDNLVKASLPEHCLGELLPRWYACNLLQAMEKPMTTQANFSHIFLADVTQFQQRKRQSQATQMVPFALPKRYLRQSVRTHDRLWVCPSDQRSMTRLTIIPSCKTPSQTSVQQNCEGKIVICELSTAPRIIKCHHDWSAEHLEHAYGW